MATDRNPLTDKELWRRLAPANEAGQTAVSDLELAAWLDGRLPAGEVARIDAAVAADPEIRRAALELTDVLGRPLPAAPARMAVRAQALVGFEAEQPVRGGSWLDRLFALRGPHPVLRRSAVASAAVMLAAMGFVMGGGLGESYAYSAYAKAPFTVDSTVEFGDFLSDGI
jgi:hypothetical protein